MPGRPLSEMERLEDEKDETNDIPLKEVQVCNHVEEGIQNERTELIPYPDNE